MFEIFLFLVSAAGGVMASIAGTGIGSLLTPFLALRLDTKLAVAAVSIPHFLATAVRFWGFRKHIDRRILLHFGILSAAGGLTGALLHTSLGSQWLSLILGVLLLYSGASGLWGFSEKIHFTERQAWIAGAFSGFFGGLVGNQGGIRSAALISVDLSKHVFVGTATAIGLIVDISRMPVYVFLERERLASTVPLIGIMIAGTLLGTFAGSFLLHRIPEKAFKRLVCGIILGLGILMLLEAFRK